MDFRDCPGARPNILLHQRNQRRKRGVVRGSSRATAAAGGVGVGRPHALTRRDGLDKVLAGLVEAKRVGFFPSLQRTLNHILIVDRFYIAGLRGEGPDHRYFDDEIPYQQANALRAEQEKSDRELIALCEDWQEADLDREVRLDPVQRLIAAPGETQ